MEQMMMSPDGKTLTLETQKITASKSPKRKPNKIADEVSNMGILGEAKKSNTDMDALKRIIDKMGIEEIK